MKNPAILLACIGLASCAAKKAIIVEEPTGPAEKTEGVAVVSEGNKPAVPPDDGMRLPEDMLSLPEDSQLRSAAEPREGEATVITRPPQE